VHLSAQHVVRQRPSEVVEFRHVRSHGGVHPLQSEIDVGVASAEIRWQLSISVSWAERSLPQSCKDCLIWSIDTVPSIP
jgi:hypothetical protein